MKRRRTASFGFNPMNVGWLKQQPRRRVADRTRTQWPRRLSNAADFEPGGEHYRAPEPEKEQEDD